MKSKEVYLKFAIVLAIVTVAYNLLEGLVAVYFGLTDETLALFGFGLDSFVEVISGVGIWHMVLRIQKNGNDPLDKFEKRSLKITGFSFYLLTTGLVITSSYNLWINAHPETTLWGVVISGLSLGVMWWLVREKRIVGKALNSNAILADANCTRACMQLSAVLLISSIGYELFNIGRIDAIGSLIISGLAFREGKEAFEKANNPNEGCDSC